jgi:prepilin-type processing-associated H-X9-DG protein
MDRLKIQPATTATAFELRTGQAQPGFVDESGRLKGMTGGLIGHLMRRQLAELLINQGQQLVGGMRITRIARPQKAIKLTKSGLYRSTCTRRACSDPFSRWMSLFQWKGRCRVTPWKAGCPANATDVDWPGHYHNNAAGLSFADGHSEIKRWIDPRTTPVLLRNGRLPFFHPSPGNPDLERLMERTTSRRANPTRFN